MNFQISNLKSQIGYTLIELMVALGIMGFIMATGLYAVRSFNNTQVVVNAQKDFVSNLRAIQNRVNSGADGRNYQTVFIDGNTSGSDSYILDWSGPSEVTVKLPPGVKVYTGPDGAPVYNDNYFCFASPNVLASYPNGYDDQGVNPLGLCGNTCRGKVFACAGSPTGVAGGTMTVRFTNGLATRNVTITGSGMIVTSINAP